MICQFTWDRLPGEKSLWYDRFWTYADRPHTNAG